MHEGVIARAGIQRDLCAVTMSWRDQYAVLNIVITKSYWHLVDKIGMDHQNGM